MNETEKSQVLLKLQAAMNAPGGMQALRFILNSLGAIPFVGGVFSGGAALWSEKEQSAFSELLVKWATLTDAQISEISGALKALTAGPTRAAFAILLGELFGREGAETLLTKAPSQIPVVLGGNSIAELQPYIREGWVNLTPTGAVCSMGSGNRVGNHVEELKHPYGMGSGFVLTVAKV